MAEISPQMERRLADLLERSHVPHTTEGAKVSGRCVLAVHCWNCSDSSFHCGVFRNSGRFHCYRCGAGGSLWMLLKSLTDTTWSEFMEWFSPGQAVEVEPCVGDQVASILGGGGSEEDEPAEVQWPASVPARELDGEMAAILQEFLEQRGFSLDDCDRFHAEVGMRGMYAGRLILPIVMGGKAVSFQARDMLGQGKRYRNPRGVPKAGLLYNADRLRWGDRLFVVEGPLDAWRVDRALMYDRESVVSIFGVLVSEDQVSLIYTAKPREVIVILDGAAAVEARRTAECLAPFVPRVLVASIPGEDDPDSYGRDFGLPALYDCMRSGERV